MKKERDTLRQIEALLEPRHLFILPEWADPIILDRLIEQGYIDCLYHQRDEKGSIQLMMGLQLTDAGRHLAYSRSSWPRRVMQASFAGATMVIMNLVILYVG